MSAVGVVGRLAELGVPAAAITDSALPPASPPRVAPESAQQAADVLGTCSREGWRVRLSGAGTRGLEVPGADLVVSAQAITGLDVYVPEDLTVGVLAGTPHGTLDRLLAEHRQVLPLDPPVLDPATLGGTFATASAGPLQAGYGTPRDLVLGMHAVTADGRVLRVGGQVVKNVAGYDLVRLLTGSRGTLALITQVHVRLRAAPAVDATLVATAREGAEAAAAALQLRQTVHPVALEVIAPHGTGPWRVACRIHGSEPVVEHAAGLVQRAAGNVDRLAPPAAAALWRELAHTEGAAGTRIQLQGPPADLAALLALAGRIADAGSDSGSREWLRFAHGADGTVRICHPSRRPPGEARLEALLPAIAAEAATLDGTCICDVGPDWLRHALPAPRPSAAVARIQADLRRQFDPAGVLVGD